MEEPGHGCRRSINVDCASLPVEARIPSAVLAGDRQSQLRCSSLFNCRFTWSEV